MSLRISIGGNFCLQLAVETCAFFMVSRSSGKATWGFLAKFIAKSDLLEEPQSPGGVQIAIDFLERRFKRQIEPDSED
jgi:hypothetical protein